MTSQDYDVAQSKVKAELEIKKLQSEIWELRYGWTKTLITAIATVVVAGGGWFLQAHLERVKNDEQRADAVTDRFFKARDALSSALAPSARGNAARDLGSLLHTSQPKRQLTDAEITTALEERLLVEDDADVLRTIATILGGAGDLALEPTRDQNRLAAVRFANAYGEYVGTAINPNTRQRVKNYTYRELEAKVRALSALDARIADAVLPVEGGRAEWGERFVGGAIASRAYTWQLFKQDLLNPSPAGPQTQDELLRTARHYAQALAATSIALEGLFRRLSGTLQKGKDLSKITLFAVDLSGDSLAFVNLEASYLSGQAIGTTFSDADLTNTTISDLYVWKANFSRATLVGTYFDDLRAFDNKGRLLSQSNFSGADWWDVCMWTPSTRSYGQPYWLKYFYPKPAGAVLRFRDKC